MSTYKVFKKISLVLSVCLVLTIFQPYIAFSFGESEKYTTLRNSNAMVVSKDILDGIVISFTGTPIPNHIANAILAFYNNHKHASELQIDSSGNIIVCTGCGAGGFGGGVW